MDLLLTLCLGFHFCSELLRGKEHTGLYATCSAREPPFNHGPICSAASSRPNATPEGRRCCRATHTSDSCITFARHTQNADQCLDPCHTADVMYFPPDLKIVSTQDMRCVVF